MANRGTRLSVTKQYNALPDKYLSRSPVRDQATIDYLSATFPNPFRGLAPVYGANISRASLLRPYPHFGDISAEEPVGYSCYHSMQGRVEKRFSQGWTLQLAYTFSKFMEATAFLNPSDPMPYEVISSLDRPHRLAASAIWEVPVGGGRRFGARLPAVLNHVLGSWQIGAIVTRQSGAPLEWGNIIIHRRHQADPATQEPADSGSLVQHGSRLQPRLAPAALLQLARFSAPFCGQPRR